MKSAWIIVLFLITGAAAQIAEPRPGFVRDRGGYLRPVLGVAGSFVLGDAVLEGVMSAGFGKTSGFAKTETEIIVFRAGEIVRRVPAPAGDALFFPGAGGEITTIYFTGAGELWRVRDLEFEKSSLAERPESKIQIRDDRLELPSGVIVTLPESVAAVEQISDSLIVARGAAALYAVPLAKDAVPVQLPEAAQ
jgi:hypothetical protein